MRSATRTVGCCVLSIALAGCSRPDPFAFVPKDPSPSEHLLPQEPWAPRALPMFSGRDGRVVTWADLMDAVASSDVVVLGEQHDDANGHAVELAVLENVLATYPGSVLALEMLERDEQAAVDALLAGELSESEFIERTGSARWSGAQSWEESYGRLVECARRHDAAVVAANAPREYVRLAGREGYESLRALPAEQQASFDLPSSLDDGAYRARLRQLMTDARAARGEGPPSEEEVEAVLRPQMTWDATMAASVARALDRRPNGVAKVVLVVGQFHSDFDGGTVLEIARRAPFARILTISLVPEPFRSLRGEDQRRADIVVSTRTAPATVVEPTTTDDAS